MLLKPSQDEYAPSYATYINLVPDEQIPQLLKQSLERITQAFSNVTEQKALYRYAEGKWSLKEVLGHIADTERVMSYRLLRIARGDQTPLAGFDQEPYVENAAFDAIPLKQLVEDYANVRKATLSLIQGLSDEAWLRTGFVNNNVLSARALAYIIAGHELHHWNIIQEKYLK